MNTADFGASLAAETPPVGLSRPLAALWWDSKGDWARAHEVVAPDEAGQDAAWVHAYLHRKEGDASNARYWYARAGHAVSTASLDAEREAILAALLAAEGHAA